MSSTPRDLAILKAVADIVREQVGKAYKALKDRLDLVETRSLVLADEVAELRDFQPEKGEKGADGTSVTAEDVLPHIEPIVIERAMAVLSNIETPKDGKDGTSVTIEDVEPLIERRAAQWALDFERRAQDILQRSLDRAPQAKDGRDGVDGKDSDPDVVAAKVIERLDLKGTRTDMKRLCGELVAAAVAEIPTPRDGLDGVDGKDAKPVTDAQIMAAVEKYLAANPPRDGRDGTDGKDGADGKDGTDGRHGKDGETVTPEQVAELVGKAVSAIPLPRDGKDGESVTPEQIDALVEKRLATRVAEWALDFEKRAQASLEKAVDRLPQPKDGRDALSLKDLDLVSEDGGRTIRLILDDGERREERTIVTSVPVYREIWKSGVSYAAGDMVTWGGSIWVALKATVTQPNGYSPDWKLAVKRGKNGVSQG
jgi:hypothetical protein